MTALARIDVAHALLTLRSGGNTASEPERRQEWRRGTQSACATSLPKKSVEKYGLK